MASRYKHLHSVAAFSIALLLIYYYTRFQFLIWITIGVVLLSVLFRPVALQVERVWLAFGKLLGLFMPKIILTVVFFFILTPIALLSRVLKKGNELDLKNTRSSLWKEGGGQPDVESFRKLW